MLGISSFGRLALASSAVSLVAACGGGGTYSLEGNGCRDLSDRMSGASMSEAVACYTSTLPALEAASKCRTIRDVMLTTEVEAGALGEAATCVLAGAERSDGAWIAELIATVAADPARVDALIGAMGAAFDFDVHGNTFAAGLTSDAQTALGERLGALPESLRAKLVEVAITYRLEPLNGYAARYVRELEPGSEAVVLYAESLDEESDVGPDERWALASSGRWTAADILDCFNGEGPCAEWNGESPLVLLDVAAPETEVSPAPNAGVRLLRNGEVTDAELAAVARWLAQGEYPNADGIADTLLVLFTDPTVPMPSRMAVAQAPSDRLCDAERLLELLGRQYFGPEYAPEDAASPWTTFIDGCTPLWDAGEALTLLSTGMWLSVDDARIDAVRARFDATAPAQDCDALFDLAENADDLASDSRTHALAFVEAARVGGDTCADRFEDVLVNTADDRRAHPLASVQAGLLLVERGNAEAGCEAVRRARAFADTNDPRAPGQQALALLAELEGRCAP